MLTNYSKTTLYVGVTNDLERRIREHKRGEGSKFTALYKAHYLIYYETFNNIDKAIKYEKQLKKWKREWKWELAMKTNPSLIDLSSDWD